MHRIPEEWKNRRQASDNAQIRVLAGGGGGSIRSQCSRRRCHKSDVQPLDAEALFSICVVGLKNYPEILYQLSRCQDKVIHVIIIKLVE